MTVHALALPLLYRTQSGSCLNLSADSRRLDAHANGDCSAHGWFGEIGDGWRTVLPESAEDLLAWCLVADQTLLLDLLAYLAALSLDALKLRHDQTSPALTHADRLAEALSLDMTTHWQGSVDGFFGRLSKAALTQAVVEAKVQTGVAVAVLKKAEAARHVASALTGTAWLPVPLRVQAPAPAA